MHGLAVTVVVTEVVVVFVVRVEEVVVVCSVTTCRYAMVVAISIAESLRLQDMISRTAKSERSQLGLPVPAVLICTLPMSLPRTPTAVGTPFALVPAHLKLSTQADDVPVV